jgi:hypothetical protein
MPALDTTPAAAAAQETAYRHLGNTGRLRIAVELSNLVPSLAEAGIRERNPGYTAEQTTEALSRLLYGADARQPDE